MPLDDDELPDPDDEGPDPDPVADTPPMTFAGSPY